MVHSLQQTASHRGWLETSDRQDLTVESGGMNLVEHELPRAATKKK
jgi:hypothetical protein